ncbi:helix-turn-helix domain-containing protein [Streptomyces sp. NPDC005508]|uniref:helix-turn-helix domain-containing protein n=1 Tax=Streptomyces sp. NPDC005508 TaxID=3154886 RepID=UPI0033AE8F3F
MLLVVRRTTDEALLHCLEGHPHLLLTWGEDRYVLGAPDLAEAVGDLPAVAAGMSRPFAPGVALKVAEREALWAVSKAVESGRPVVRYGDDATGRWLPDDPAVLTALVEHVLGEVLRYDEAHDSHLLVSARTWMERDRRTETAAAALHIHPNTLAYRLRRFGALSHRDLAATGALAEVWLAIQAAGALGLTD